MSKANGARNSPVVTFMTSFFPSRVTDRENVLGYCFFLLVLNPNAERNSFKNPLKTLRSNSEVIAAHFGQLASRRTHGPFRP